MSALHRLPLLLAAVLAVCAGFTLAQDGPAGRTVYVGRLRAEPSAFESGAPIKSDEVLTPLVLFDAGRLPSGDTTSYKETPDHRYLKILRPYDGSSFPRNIAAPLIRWEDHVDNAWMLSLNAPGWDAPLRVVTDRRQWRPHARTWEAVKASGTGDWVEVEVRGCRLEEGRRAGGAVYADRVRFRVSPHPADPLVVFRFVTPLFHGAKAPDVLYQDIGAFERHMFLPGKGIYCTNCHSFPSRPAAGEQDVTMAIAVRKSFTELRQLGIYNFGSREAATVAVDSFFMCWDGAGTKIAVTAGTQVLVREPITLETQEFHVTAGDIVIVDRDTLAAVALPGASEPDYAEAFPAWSPDGETIVFARDQEIKLGRGIPPKKYSLYRVPYNGGQGGPIASLPGAEDGMSNFAPRFSPDGKWIVFNKAESDSLVEPSADLWIISTEEGALARKLECNYDYAMDSHHSWSSNSRWLLFATKRDDGIFTRVYLTEIDEGGHASPPVELPSLDDPLVCYNVPEFLRSRPEIDAEDILRKLSRERR